MIEEKDLIEYGFKKDEAEFPIWPFVKDISETGQDGNSILLVLTLERNSPEFALVSPDGEKYYLRVENLEQLKTFEESIQSWEPNY